MAERRKDRKGRRSDVRRFYNMLADERMLKISTIDNIHTVLHQVLDLAVEDEYLRSNPSDNALKELKQSHNFDVEKRRALTVQEQNAFIYNRLALQACCLQGSYNALCLYTALSPSTKYNAFCKNDMK